MPPSAPLLVLGLDGASFEVLDPLIAAGELPNLAAWRRAGFAAPLRSTVPAMSFPAWSTFQTGLEPGRHGLFDFTQKLPGAYRIRFTNATDRAGRSLFDRVSRAGGTVLALGMPATFPPEPVSGLLVAGFDAPVSTGTEPRSASDPALYRGIAARVGPWMQADLDEQAGAEAWGEAAAAKLVARVERKRRFALEALRQLRERGTPPQLMCVVFSESDTVAHHFWRDHDPDSPRHDPSASSGRRGAVTAVYRALDAACGELRQAFGDEALCVVASDHGSGGASRHVVHLGRRLAEAGLLTRSAAGGLDRWARGARDTALRWLPPGAAEAIFRRSRGAAARVESAARFGGFDWRRSPAFSEEANTQPGVWINLAGREAEGCVAPADYERARDDVIAALREWPLPGGGAVVARARRREEVYVGAYLERAPDVVVELAEDAGYGLSLVPTPWQETNGSSVRRLADDELAGGRGRGMNGTHRPDGVWIAHGEGAAAPIGATPAQVEGAAAPIGATPAQVEGAAAPAGASHAHLRDVAPTLLAAMGVGWESQGAGPDGSDLLRQRVAYSEAEEAQVAQRLRALGYLE